MDWSNITTLVAVALGFGLSELAGYLKGRKERRLRLFDIRMEAYAEWMSGMESMMHSWTSRKGVRKPPGMGVLHKKLELLESDPDALRLLNDILGTLPLSGSREYQLMDLAAHSDESFDWLPFREKMNELIECIRSRRPD